MMIWTHTLMKKDEPDLFHRAYKKRQNQKRTLRRQSAKFKIRELDCLQAFRKILMHNSNS